VIWVTVCREICDKRHRPLPPSDGLLVMSWITLTGSAVSVQHLFAPKRVTITLPYHVFVALVARADREGRSTSNLAAFLLESSLAVPQVKPADRRLRGDSGLSGYPLSDDLTG
jgi:hypothetical protein